MWWDNVRPCLWFTLIGADLHGLTASIASSCARLRRNPICPAAEIYEVPRRVAVVFLEPAGSLVWSDSATIKRAEVPAEPAPHTLYTPFNLYSVGLGSLSPFFVFIFLVTFSRWESLRLIGNNTESVSGSQVDAGASSGFKGAAAGVTSDLRGCVQVLGHLLDLLKDTVGH